MAGGIIIALGGIIIGFVISLCAVEINKRYIKSFYLGKFLYDREVEIMFGIAIIVYILCAEIIYISQFI